MLRFGNRSQIQYATRSFGAPPKMLTDPPDKFNEHSGELPSTITSSLLRRVCTNDQEAWDRMVALFYPMAYGWCRRAGLQASDAADTCQEVFRGVAAGITTFKRENPGDTFRGWMRRITQRRISDHRRAEKKRPEPMGGSSGQVRMNQLPSPHADKGSSERHEPLMLRGVLALVRDEFEQKTWTAFWRTAVDGQPAAAVAAELGITTNAVYMAKSHVLRRLREELGDPWKTTSPEPE